jgi:predicted dehydrogenase
MEQTRIGIIGAGFIARRHLDTLRRFPDVAVVAVADPVSARAQEAAAPDGATVYAEHAAMLDAEALDAVFVCVPPFAHGPPENTLIERGLPFFVEKPLATDLDTAERIARALDQRKLVTAVGYHWRHLDTTDRARALLQQRPARLAVGYWLDSTPPPPWWAVQAESGGQMIEQTTHMFDLARYLVGEVETVYATSSRIDRVAYPDADVHDVSTATLHFASGAVGSISSTCLLHWPHRIGLHLYGDGFALELSETELVVDEGHGRAVEPVDIDPFAREDRDFIDAVQGKTNQIRVPHAEALRTHRLTTGAVRSARERQPIQVAS